MVSEGRLELPAFAFVARCDDPISLLRRWSIENGGSGATRTPNGLPRTCFRDRPNNQLSHASMKWRRDWDSNPERIAPHGLASRSNTIIASLQDCQVFKERNGLLHGVRRQNNLSGLASFAGPLFALMLHLAVCLQTRMFATPHLHYRTSDRNGGSRCC